MFAEGIHSHAPRSLCKWKSKWSAYLHRDSFSNTGDVFTFYLFKGFLLCWQSKQSAYFYKLGHGYYYEGLS